VKHRDEVGITIYTPWQSTSVSFQVVSSRHKTVFHVWPSACCLKPVSQATTTSVS